MSFSKATSSLKPKAFNIFVPSRYGINKMSYSTLKMDANLLKSNIPSKTTKTNIIDHTQAQTKWMEFDDWGKIRYHVVGNGPHTLLFVHGLLANWTVWKHIVPILAPKYRLVMPDLPLGAHTKIHQEDSSPITLVAQDTGGALSQIALANNPQMPIQSVVLCSCDAFENFLPFWVGYVKYVAKIPLNSVLWMFGHLLQFKLVRNFPLIFGWLFKKGLNDKEIIEAITAPMRSDFHICRDARKIMSSIDSKFTLDAAEKLKKFDKPVLIAWAKEDKIFPPKDAERLAEVIPKSELKWIEDSYAFSMIDQPEVLAQYIDEFVSKHHKN